MAIQIRTGMIFLNCPLYIVERDGFCAVFVVESDDHLVVMQVDGIDKNVNQPLAVILSVDVQLTELVQPEGDKLRADPRLRNLLIGDLDFQIFLGTFQFFETAFRGLSEDAHLDISIGNLLRSSPDFPPIHTVHERFHSHGVPSSSFTAVNQVRISCLTPEVITLLKLAFCQFQHFHVSFHCFSLCGMD